MNRVSTAKYLSGPLRNQRGSIIGLLIFLLALVGAWYLYQSYNRGQVKSNLKTISNDYVHGVQHGIKKIIPPERSDKNR
jgi:hypothetical protein